MMTNNNNVTSLGLLITFSLVHLFHPQSDILLSAYPAHAIPTCRVAPIVVFLKKKILTLITFRTFSFVQGTTTNADYPRSFRLWLIIFFKYVISLKCQKWRYSNKLLLKWYSTSNCNKLLFYSETCEVTLQIHCDFSNIADKLITDGGTERQIERL